jgi:Ni/Fe-hydrogenase 1 B-type cytochrome subunit
VGSITKGWLLEANMDTNITIHMNTTILGKPLPFRASKPASLRLWHWLTFLFFLASISTVIFGSTLFRTRDNVELVQEAAKNKGAELNPDQARFVAHEFSDKLWMLHKWIGIGLCVLLLWRLIIEYAGNNGGTVAARMKQALGLSNDIGEKKHVQWVYYGYILFYILFGIMALTGLVLAFEDVEWLKVIHKPANKVHEIAQYGIYSYALVHIAGVIRADMSRYPGIISRMVHGKGGMAD